MRSKRYHFLAFLSVFTLLIGTSFMSADSVLAGPEIVPPPTTDPNDPNKYECDYCKDYDSGQKEYDPNNPYSPEWTSNGGHLVVKYMYHVKRGLDEYKFDMILQKRMGINGKR